MIAEERAHQTGFFRRRQIGLGDGAQQGKSSPVRYETYSRSTIKIKLTDLAGREVRAAKASRRSSRCDPRAA